MPSKHSATRAIAGQWVDAQVHPGTLFAFLGIFVGLVPEVPGTVTLYRATLRRSDLEWSRSPIPGPGAPIGGSARVTSVGLLLVTAGVAGTWLALVLLVLNPRSARSRLTSRGWAALVRESSARRF